MAPVARLLCATALATYLMAKLLPLPAPYGATVALTISGTPAAVGFALAGADVELGLSPRRLAAWRSRRGVYVPATPAEPNGYWVRSREVIRQLLTRSQQPRRRPCSASRR